MCCGLEMETCHLDFLLYFFSSSFKVLFTISCLLFRFASCNSFMGVGAVENPDQLQFSWLSLVIPNKMILLPMLPV